MSIPKLLSCLLVVCCWLSNTSAETSNTKGDTFRVENFVIKGDNPLSVEETNSILHPYIGQYSSISSLNAAKDALNARFRETGGWTKRAVLPEQTINDGLVRFEIIEFELGALKVKGNKHFSNGNILSSLPNLRAGAFSKNEVIFSELAFANEHPAKSLEILFADSPITQKIDATIKVADERPYSVFTIFNTRGTEETKGTRLTLGAQHSNLFGRDHVLTVTYTGSPEDLSTVRQYGVTYRLPIYRFGGVVSAYYVDSDVDAGQVGGFIEVSNAGEFYGFQYRQTLKKLGGYKHSLTLGFDNKLFENALTFGNFSIPNDVRSRPFSATYNGDYSIAAIKTSFYTTYSRNLPGGSNGGSQSYNSHRFEADDNWDVLRLGGRFDYPIAKDWVVSGRFNGQLSDEPLIPGEQFGLGGMYSVRGYEERFRSGDIGASASAELWSPPIVQNLRGIIFLDHGYRKNKQSQPGEKESENLASTGLGVLWTWRRSISVTANMAFALREVGRVNRGDVRGNFELVARY